MALASASISHQPDAPAHGAFLVTLSDTEDLPRYIRGFIVATAGDVKITPVDDGVPVVLPDMVAGCVHPVGAKRIWSTGTEPTTIIGLY